VPEILEVEEARRLIDAKALARPIATVHAPDAWYLKRGLTPLAIRSTLPGLRFSAARRRGKLLLLDTDDGRGPTLGLHLGMSGRILVDAQEAGDPLVYASNRDVDEWRRFGVSFEDGGRLALRDPRRLGAVELDPDEERLGVDAFALSLGELRSIVARSRAPLKAVLMDQARIAGLGNLLVDESLWRAGLDPSRSADTLDVGEQARLHRAIRTTLRVLGRRGGSHTGDLMPSRVRGGHCPRDGAELQRRQVGGRTTYSCPDHQR
jgi:formamidopyrimidine-DNA glycosylase